MDSLARGYPQLHVTKFIQQSKLQLLGVPNAQHPLTNIVLTSDCTIR